ncbi:MAG: hypothetical protein HYV09_07870 [Deltaproteobacteria bacterium]|nr:hypothetical protein [Deltaproteobacteria bacterium]
MHSFCTGVDLGQARDHTAIVIVERVTGSPETYHVRHAERPPLGTAYPAVVSRVASILASAPMCGVSSLVVDASGVGRPVVDLFVAAGLRPIGVTITAGATASGGGTEHRVPKRDLCALLQVLLQGRRLRIAAAMAERAALVEELLAFRVKIDGATARDSYGAGSGTHDDLVMALALACWGAREAPAPLPVAGLSEAYQSDEDDPWDFGWVLGTSRPVTRAERAPRTIPGAAGAPPNPRPPPPYVVR